MEKRDRRIRRTEKSLHDALISLLLEKNYDSITVQEILDRADVGRATFYSHFKGKDELLISGAHGLRSTLNSAVRGERSHSESHEVIIGFSGAGMACFSTAFGGNIGRNHTARMQSRNPKVEEDRLGCTS